MSSVAARPRWKLPSPEVRRPGPERKPRDSARPRRRVCGRRGRAVCAGGLGPQPDPAAAPQRGWRDQACAPTSSSRGPRPGSRGLHVPSSRSSGSATRDAHRVAAGVLPERTVVKMRARTSPRLDPFQGWGRGSVALSMPGDLPRGCSCGRRRPAAASMTRPSYAWEHVLVSLSWDRSLLG